MQTLDEIILQDLKTTLNVAESFTSGTVFRFSQMGHPYEAVPCIDIVFGGIELIKTTNEYSENDMTVYINIFTRDESTNTDGVMSALTHSVIKAIMVDPTRGRRALKTEIKRVEPGMIVPGQPEVDRLIELNIRFRSNTKNPDKN